MLALAEILALIILNALIQAAFARWKVARRASPQRRRKATVDFQYPLHPGPAASALRFDGIPEHAAHIRPAGIDW